MITVAKEEDLKEVIKMSLKIPKELGIENLPEVNVEKVSETFYENYAKSPIFIYKENGEIKGFLATAIVEFWWSNTKMLNDYAVFVEPGDKKLEVFNALIGAMRDLGKINKMPVVSHFLASKRLEAKQKVFEKQDYTIHGFIATHGI